MKKHLTVKSLVLIALLGLLAGLSLTACQTEKSHEHPAGEHPKK